MVISNDDVSMELEDVSFYNCILVLKTNTSGIIKIESNESNPLNDIIPSSLSDNRQTNNISTDNLYTADNRQTVYSIQTHDGMLDSHPSCTGKVIEQKDNLYLEQENNDGLFYDEIPIYTDIPQAMWLISESSEPDSNTVPNVSKMFVHSADTSNADNLSIPHPSEHEFWQDTLGVKL